MASRVLSMAKSVSRATASMGGVPRVSSLGLVSNPRGGFPVVAQGLLSASHGSSLHIPARLMSTNWKPEVAFQRLKPEDQQVVLLVQAIVAEAQKTNEEGVRELLVELNKIAAAQKSHQTFLDAFVFSFASGAGAIYWTSQEYKSQMLAISSNLAENSGEIISDLVSAAKHGVDSPRILGKGKPFTWKPKWLEPKEGGVEKEGGAK